MSLATRCPACATVFRVVQDQLRVSEGWVRCGRCGEVFNAAHALVNIDGSPRTAAPPPAAPPPAPTPSVPLARRGVSELPPTPRAEAAIIEPESDFEPTQPPFAGDLPPTPNRRSGEPEFVVSDYEPPVAGAAGSEPDDELGRIDIESLAQRAAAAQSHAPVPAAPPAEPIVSVVSPPTAPAPAFDESPAEPFHESAPMAPSFVQTADRAARWQDPRVKRGLWLLASVGLLVLGLQVLYEYRAIAAARWPALRPVLVQSCELLGCQVDALRQIESLAVESSGLVRIDGTALYRLSVVLRNKAPLELAQPSLDLSLTDAQGKVIARRVLTLAELGIASRTMAPSAELPIQAAVSVGDRQVVGYTVELFYP